MSVTAVPGIRVGHWTDQAALTGCTVVLPPPGTLGSVFVSGGAPGTRETDALAPGMLDHDVHAVLLTGGSAYGLGAADGVMRHLESQGVGLPIAGHVVPIVPAAVIFDLGIGDGSVRPGPEQGEAACLAASETEAREGNVGAGAGATVGKWKGPEFAVKGGLGAASREREGIVCGAIAVVNAVGDVLDEDGTILAGSRAPAGAPHAGPGAGNTTICCVATNVTLDPAELHRVARIATAALGRAIHPVHTAADGDAVFALSTCARALPPETPSVFATAIVGAMCSDALADAIRRGVRAATSAGGVPAARA